MLRSVSTLVLMLVALAMMVTAPTTSDARSLDEIISSGKVRIGVHPNIPPLSYRDTAGVWQGFDVDLGKLIADKIGVKVEYVPVEWKARVPALISDQIDFSMAALTRNSKRAKVIDFTVPIHTENLAVLTTDKVKDVKSWKDLNREGLTMVGCRGCFPVRWMIVFDASECCYLLPGISSPAGREAWPRTYAATRFRCRVRVLRSPHRPRRRRARNSD